MEIEAGNIGDLFKCQLVLQKKSYRDVARETGVSISTISRFTKRPYNIQTDAFLSLWEWMSFISEAELILLWRASKRTPKQGGE